MKDIKDFLHLYLGCDFVTANSQGNINTSSIGEVYSYFDHFKQFKLVLRKLSSITEEEIVSYLRLKHNAYNGEYEVRAVDNGFWWAFRLNTLNERFNFYGEILDESNSDQFRYLLSKAFDLFGLIDEGLAIDKATLEKQETEH